MVYLLLSLFAGAGFLFAGAVCYEEFKRPKLGVTLAVLGVVISLCGSLLSPQKPTVNIPAPQQQENAQAPSEQQPTAQ